MNGRLASRCISALAVGLMVVCSELVPAHAGSVAAAVPDATAQTGGTRTNDYAGARVYAVATAGGTTYLGGAFTKMRPARASFGGSGTVTRNHLAAVDAAGVLTSWDPDANHEVRAVAVGPDGTVFVGGAFTAIGGVNRNHLAALDPVTGSVLPWNPDVRGEIHTILITEHKLYVGGNFTSIDGRPRTRLAAFGLASLALTTWQPTADNSVLALALAPDESILVGGFFGSVDGRTDQDFLADLDPVSGAVRPMASHPSYQVEGIDVSGSRIVAGEGGPGGKVQRFAWPGMKLAWTAQLDGDVQALAIRNALVYVGGHFLTYCRGGTGSGAPFQCDKPIDRGKLAALELTTGALAPWDPQANGPLGVFALSTTSSSLLAGGEFTVIHGMHQQGLARFSF